MNEPDRKIYKALKLHSSDAKNKTKHQVKVLNCAHAKKTEEAEYETKDKLSA